MQYSYHLTAFSWVLVATTGIALAVAFVLWQRRRAPGALHVFWIELAAAWWALAGAFEAAGTTVALKQFWSQVSYLGVVTAPVLFLLFARDYSQPQKRLSARQVGALFVMPVLTLLVAATNGLHHALWTSITVNPVNYVATYGHGAWFWIFMAYTYAVLMCGVALLLSAWFHFPAHYRSQTAVLLVGSALPLAANLLYLVRFGPLQGWDWTPSVFALTGIVLAWGLSRYRVFDLIPLARDRLVESMADGVLVVDARQRIVDVNPAAQALFADRGLEKPRIGATVPALLADWPQLCAGAAAGPARMEMALGANGSRYVEIQAVPLRGKASDLVGCLTILRDVTDRRRAEERLRQLNATLESQVAARTAEIRSEKEKSETVLRSVGAAICLADADMRIQYVNEAFARLTGYTPGEVVGSDVATIGARIHSEQARHALRTAIARGQTWRGEATGRRKDGRKYDAILTIAPVVGENGRLEGIVSSHQDISQSKRLERARSQFMRNVSHELRTPVSNIKLYANLLQAARNPEKTEQYMGVLTDQVGRLEHLIQDTLAIAALDSGEPLTSWKPLALPVLAESVIERYADRAAAAGLTLRALPLPSALPEVKGDAEALATALGELVENAINFTPAGGEVAIEMATAETNGVRSVTIAVRDTGPGLEREEREHVFERFFRGRHAAAGHIPGSGLGLSIAQEIVHAHGGDISVSSAVQAGSTFTVWLPESTGRAGQS
jgi:PAS domain S-box-containing protein